MSIFQNYIKATKLADSIKEIPGHECQVIAGSNDGYFIEAFGISYRFASIECPKMIAKLFVDIVAVGPVSKITDEVIGEKVLTVGQCARICRVAQRTMDGWIQSGKLNRIDRFVAQSELIKFMKKYELTIPENFLEVTSSN